MHVTEMISDLFLFNLPLASTPVTILAATAANLPPTTLSTLLIFSARNFITDVYGTKNWHRKPAPEIGVDLWRQFLQRVSWVVTRGVSTSATFVQFN